MEKIINTLQIIFLICAITWSVYAIYSDYLKNGYIKNSTERMAASVERTEKWADKCH